MGTRRRRGKRKDESSSGEYSTYLPTYLYFSTHAPTFLGDFYTQIYADFTCLFYADFYSSSYPFRTLTGLQWSFSHLKTTLNFQELDVFIEGWSYKTLVSVFIPFYEESFFNFFFPTENFPVLKIQM